MIKVINPNIEIWHQEDYTLDSIWKHIARCARVCYQSTPKNKDEDDYHFLVRTLFKGKDVLNKRLTADDIVSMHLSVCEHGTIHLRFPLYVPRASVTFDLRYRKNSFSKWRSIREDDCIYVTTNMRVLLENGWIDDLEFIDEIHDGKFIPRTTISFITNIGVSRELNRHRCHSISEESTRYCAYDKGKFGNNITITKTPWIPYSDADGQCYEDGFYKDDEVFDGKYVEGHYTEGWTAIDWYLYSIQIANLAYKKCRELGWSAQWARDVLPLATKTQVVHTAFNNDWNHWILLRSNGVSGAPHPEIKELADKLKVELNTSK